MVERPRFSILMPTHSRVDVIGHAIRSVLDQTVPDFELFVVGDGCAAGTEEVVAGFCDARIRFFDLPKAPYFGYANRNIALREARGALIAFAADDDLWFPDHLETLGAALEGGAVFAHSQALWVSSDGILAPALTNLEFGDELCTFLDRSNTLCAGCIIYRGDALPRRDSWPEDVPEAADWRLWHRIIRENPAHSPICRRIPTVLHFSALRKKARHSNFGPLAMALDIADSADWWPAELRVAIPEGTTEQSVFAGMMRADPAGWAERVRLAASDLTARLCWDFLLTNRPALIRTQSGLDAARNELDATRSGLAAARSERDAHLRDLEAIRASTSWRITGPLRAAVTALRRIGW